jgi:hypothetical protein
VGFGGALAEREAMLALSEGGDADDLRDTISTFQGEDLLGGEK